MKKRKVQLLGLVVYAFSLSTQEVETGRYMSSRPDMATQ